MTVHLSKRFSAGVIDYEFKAGMHEDNLGGEYGGRDACPGFCFDKWSGAVPSPDSYHTTGSHEQRPGPKKRKASAPRFGLVQGKRRVSRSLISATRDVLSSNERVRGAQACAWEGKSMCDVFFTVASFTLRVTDAIWTSWRTSQERLRRSRT